MCGRKNAEASHFSYTPSDQFQTLGSVYLNFELQMSIFATVSPSQRIFYALSALGLLIPWGFNLRYFFEGGSVMPSVFWPDAFANSLTTAITLDVYLAAAAFSVWVLHERRLRRPWLYVLMCFGIGLGFVLPLYLARREVRVD